MNEDFKSCCFEYLRLNAKIENLSNKENKTELDNEILGWYFDAEKFYLKRLKHILKDLED